MPDTTKVLFYGDLHGHPGCHGCQICFENLLETVFFVSGHLDLTPEEFQEHYVPLLERALHHSSYPRFIVGDARGADTMAQQWLKDHEAEVKVYHMLTTPRNNQGGFLTLGGFTSDTERDEAMTRDSEFDLAWVRPGRETSGTAKNIQRRETLWGNLGP